MQCATGRGGRVLDRDELLEHVEWLLNEGEAERAWMLCKRGLRRYPKDGELWLFLGDSLFDSDRLQEADRAFRRVAEIEPAWAIPFAKRAEVHLMLGNVQRAREMVDEAYKRDPDLPHASYVRAICYELEGNLDTARFFYHRSRHLQPDQYFPPVPCTNELFAESFDAALAHLLDVDAFARSLTHTNWVVCDAVDREDPALKGVSPMMYCFLVPDQADAEEPQVVTGYVFRRNILRECRTMDDVDTQIYVSIMDELEILLGPGEE
jgi:tetratricopeptide (TPR) repeat protein